VNVKAGQTLFMNPGTIHALGPGLLIYEIQQTSDLTYRVYDWGRPQTEARKLHIDKALAVSNPNAISAVMPEPQINDGELKTLTECQYFKLEIILTEEKSATLDTRGESFHALTVIEGQSQIRAGGAAFILNKFETLLIPAICGEYQIIPIKKSRLLKASV
jgi:mannose-6-phosphate isomerase